jgi:hypothetical protein
MPPSEIIPLRPVRLMKRVSCAGLKRVPVPLSVPLPLAAPSGDAFPASDEKTNIEPVSGGVD